jgi:hypothetical protein
MAQGSGEIDQLQSQIEQTRAEMSDTIDAIQSRLSPKRVLAEAKDSVTEATVARLKRLKVQAGATGNGALRRVQDNPLLPVALLLSAAAGLFVRAWTVRRRRRHGQPRHLLNNRRRF